MPCVVLGTEPIPDADQVNVDAAMGAYLATRHLLDLGHRSIGMICWRSIGYRSVKPGWRAIKRRWQNLG